MTRMQTEHLRKSDVLEEHYARQGVWNLGLSRCQLFGGVLSQTRVGAPVLVTAAGLEADIKREQAVVIEQTLAPDRKVAIRPDPNFREIVHDVWIHVLADAKGQNCVSVVDHKPRGRVIPAELFSDVMVVRHKEGSYGPYRHHAIRNCKITSSQ